MLKNLILISAITLNFNLWSQDTDSVYYYRENGDKEWWYIQKDVFSFRLQNGLEYSNSETDMSVVDSTYQRKNSTRKMNLLEFRPNTNENQREIEKGRPRNQPNFECEFLVLTKDKLAPKSDNKWKTSDDIILVLFKNAGISNSEVAQFMSRNDLVPYHTPSNNLPSQGNWTYAFRIRTDRCGQTNSIKKAKEIFENESEIVKLCTPNLKVYEAFCDESYEYSNLYDAPNALWWIDNNGGQVHNSYFGDLDADVDLCECWQAGYSGNGVKVGVIDTRGFEYDHEDMQNVFTSGWNAVDNVSFNNNVYEDGYESIGHGMVISGLIAANKNNAGTIGAAYNSNIYPVLSAGEILHMIIGVQKSVEANCDVVNMSFGLDFDSEDYTPEKEEILHNEITQASSFGRYKAETQTYYGIVFVAATGNDKRNFIPINGSDTYMAGYRTSPAGYDEVIGVGNSNIYDRHEFITTTNGAHGGPRGGEWYEVAAPGSLLISTDLKGAVGYSPTDYTLSNLYTVSGTSLSAPLVSGIVAILLEKNPFLTWQEIRQAIVDGAEKVHPELYDYNYYPDYPGVSNQMYYGRASCINSLNLIDASTVSVFENSIFDGLIVKDKTLSNQSDDKLIIEIRDIQAKLISKIELDSKTDFTLNDYNQGLYLVSVFDVNDNFLIFVKMTL